MRLVLRIGVLIGLIFFVFLSTNEVKAQEWEYGVALGTSGYMGEFNQDKIYQFNSLSGSIGAKYNFNSTWGIRSDLSILGIKGDGARSRNPDLVDSTFSKTLKEWTVSGEFNFFKFEPSTKRAAYTPFVFAGLGAVMFDPMGRHQDAGNQIIRPTILAGAGFKYNLKGAFSLESRLTYRKAVDRYLDNYYSELSPSSNAFDKAASTDSYMTFLFGLTYTFFKQGCPTW